MLIFPYDEQNALNFEKIRQQLAKSLAGINFTIEHIGSTAIPNLAAKKIIDIDIVYHDEYDFEKIKKCLESINYYHNGDQGITGREVFKRTNGNNHIVLDKIVHHLYVCKHNCAELKRHLLFRDYLRKHDGARVFYEQLKYELANEANNDKKTYAELKELKANSFINYIVLLAKNE